MKFQQLFEEWATSREDNFVSLDALIFTGQGDISEVSVIPQLCKRPLHKLLEIIPLQAKLLIRHG